jgi:hypothetical protein
MSHLLKLHLNAVRRLRAIAQAIESGKNLVDVASLYRIPLGALRRVVTPKRSLRRPSKAISPAVLSQALELIKSGHTYQRTAEMLHVKSSTLTMVLLKHGYTAEKLRPPSERSENIRLALADYQQGLKIAEICRQRRIPERVLYIHLKKEGIPCRQPHQPASKARQNSAKP